MSLFCNLNCDKLNECHLKHDGLNCELHDKGSSNDSSDDEETVSEFSTDELTDTDDSIETYGSELVDPESEEEESECDGCESTEAVHSWINASLSQQKEAILQAIFDMEYENFMFDVVNGVYPNDLHPIIVEGFKKQQKNRASKSVLSFLKLLRN